MTSETQRINAAKHKNWKAGKRANPSPPVHPAFVLQQQRGSEPSIRERQSHSLNAAKRSGSRQPSMPKFNLKDE